MQETKPLARLAANLSRRRWFLASLWLALSCALPILDLPIGRLLSSIFGPTFWLVWFHDLQLPRPGLVIVLLVFAYLWFRLCLRNTPEAPGIQSTAVNLLGKPREFLSFLKFAGIFLVGGGMVYVVTRLLSVGLLDAAPWLFALIFQSRDLALAAPRLLPCVPLILLAPVLARAALVVPAAAVGQPLTIRQARGLTRHPARRWAVMLAALCFAVLIMLPTGIYVIQIYSEMPFLGQLGIVNRLWTSMFMLLPPLVATVILVELLADRYLRETAGINPVGEGSAEIH